MTNDESLIWTEKSSKLLLKTAVFDVTERHSLSADGLEGDYIVLNAKDWVITIPVLGDDFIMVKQWRHGEKALSIEFPGGVLNKNEDPADGAARELLEETGYKAGKLTKLGSVNPNPALFSNHVHFYLAEDLQKVGEQNLDEDEYLNCFTMKQSDVIKEIGGKDYPHALMLSALGLYLAREQLIINK